MIKRRENKTNDDDYFETQFPEKNFQMQRNFFCPSSKETYKFTFLQFFIAGATQMMF